MVKTKMLMVLALLLATSVDAGRRKRAQQKQQAQARAWAQAQQEKAPIQQEESGCSGLERVLTRNITGQILGYLSSQDCVSLLVLGRQIQKKLRNAAPPPLVDTSVVSKMLLNAKPGTFCEMYSQAIYEVPNIAALSKNLPHLHLRRMTATVLDLKNLVNSGQALTPEVIERLKELELPLAGPIELLQYKELWPQVCVLSLDVNSPDYPVELLRPFAEQENRPLTLMMKCNVGQIREDELIRTDHSEAIREACTEKLKVRVRRTYAMFFRVADEIEQLNLGLVRDMDCILHGSESSFWSEQFSHLHNKKCFQDLRGYHLAQSFHDYLYGFCPLKMLNHLPSSIESLSMPAQFLLNPIMPQMPYDVKEKQPLINTNLTLATEVGKNIVNCLKKMHNLREFNFYELREEGQLYALLYFPKDILLRGKVHSRYLPLVKAVLNHFSCLDKSFELSYEQPTFCYYDQSLPLGLKKHPLINKKKYRFTEYFESNTYQTWPEEVTDLTLSNRLWDLESKEIVSYLKSLQSLQDLKKLRFNVGFNMRNMAVVAELKKLIASYNSRWPTRVTVTDILFRDFQEKFFTSCQPHSFPKHILFMEPEAGPLLAAALKALPVHIEKLSLELFELSNVDFLSGTFSHLQNLKKFSFACAGFSEEINLEAQKDMQKFFACLGQLRSLKSISFECPKWRGVNLDVLKAVPAHVEKLNIKINDLNMFDTIPEAFFALKNLQELSLHFDNAFDRNYDRNRDRDPVIDKFLESLGKMKSLKKVSFIDSSWDISAAFLSEKALVGVEKIYRRF